MPLVNINTAKVDDNLPTDATITPVQQPDVEVASKPFIQPQSEWSSPHANPDPDQEDTSFTAGFKRNNPIWNWSTSETAGQALGGQVDPSYDFLAGIKGTKYMAYGEKFANTVNDMEAQQLKTQLDREEELRATASKDWTGIVGAVAGSIADPTILLPGIAGAKAVRAGAAIAEAGVKSAGLGALAIGAQEAQLQVTQETRSTDESLFNTAAGAVLSGILGAGATALTSGRIAMSKKLVESVLKGEEPPAYVGEIPAAELDALHSAGAAEARLSNPEDVKIEPVFMPKWISKKYPTVAEKLDKWLIQGIGLQIGGLKTPALSGIISDSFIVRDITRRLFNFPLKLKEQTTGTGFTGKAAVIPMENRVWSDAVDSATLMKSFDTDYKRFLDRTGKDPSFLQSGRERQNFNTESMKAYNRGGASDIPEAREVATKTREQIQKVNKRLVELKVLDEESAKLIDRGDAMRVYNVEKVAAERGAMKRALIEYYNNVDGHVLKQDALELNAKIDDAIDSILHIGDEQVVLSDLSRLSQDKGVRFTKTRTIDAPNTVLEPWLVNDLPAVANLYLKQASHMIRFQEALNEMGYESMSALKKGLKDEYTGKKHKVVRKAAESDVRAKHPGKFDEITPENVAEFQATVSKAIESGQVDVRPEVAAQHAKIDKTTAKEEDFLNDILAIALGQYSKKTAWDSALKLLRTYNTTTMLGGATLSSLSDLAVPIMRHGLNKVLTGWEEKIRTSLIPSIRAMSKKDAEQLGMIVEYQQNSIVNAMFDIGADHSLSRTGVDKWNKSIAAATGNINLLGPWTSFAKDLETHIATNDIISRLENYSAQSLKSKTFLNEHFIDEAMGNRILQQQQKWGLTNGPTRILNIDKWTDEGAKQTMRAATIKNVRGSVLTPGIGERSLWASNTQLGSTVLQFKTFLTAAEGNILLRGFQQRDGNVLMGLTAMGLFGILSQLLKDKAMGRKSDYSMYELLKLAVSNSGMLGLISDPLFNQILRNSVSSKNSYRFQNNGMIEYLLGPSASTINNTYKVLKDIGSADISDSTVKKAIRLTPYNNVFYIRGLYNLLND